MDGEAPDEAKRPPARRRRRGRGGKGRMKAQAGRPPEGERRAEPADAARAAPESPTTASQTAASQTEAGAPQAKTKPQSQRQTRVEATQRPSQTAAEPAADAPAAGRGSGEEGAPGSGRSRRAFNTRRRRGPIYAALDLGTNNCRLLVARAEGEAFQIIDSFSRVVRLGEGLSETGLLSDEAIERSVAALSICADRVAKHRALRLRAVATEACRRASNQRRFLDRVRAETGIQLDVVAAEEEARLAVAGCAPLLDVNADELLVFDIGGGSTELIWVDLSRTTAAKRRSLLMALAHGASRSDRARAAAQHIRDWVSIPVGVVTLGELFENMPDDDAKFHAMHGQVQALLADFLRRNGPITPERLARMQMLGTSGTITTLAGVHLELERYSRRAVDGLWIARSHVEDVIERLVYLSAADRRRIPCIGDDRATNLMAGAAILRAILRGWPTRRLRVADRGLREGMLYGLIQDGLARRRAGRGGPKDRGRGPQGDHKGPGGPTGGGADG